MAQPLQPPGSCLPAVRNSAQVNPSDLSPEERAWAVANEQRWRRAHDIAAKNPGIDPGDIYHVLCTYYETPSERVRRSLAHARLRSRTR
jgi:hypothetical protein